jgi:hypothetical protein
VEHPNREPRAVGAGQQQTGRQQWVHAAERDGHRNALPRADFITTPIGPARADLSAVVTRRRKSGAGRRAGTAQCDT